MPKSTGLPLVLLNGASPYTTSEIVAECAGVKRHAVKSLIEKHRSDLEDFGKVAFQMQPLPGSKTGQKITVYHLNEQQATLLMTYLKNTEQVRAFKKELVRQFYAMRDFIRERQSPIWQDTRALGKEIRRMETDAIKALVAYAEAQGSQHAARYYPEYIQPCKPHSGHCRARQGTHRGALGPADGGEGHSAGDQGGHRGREAVQGHICRTEREVIRIMPRIGPSEAPGAALIGNRG